MKVSKGYLSFLKIKKKKKRKEKQFFQIPLDKTISSLEDWVFGVNLVLSSNPSTCLLHERSTICHQLVTILGLHQIGIKGGFFFSCDPEFMKRSAWLEDKFRWMEKKDGAFFLVKSMYQASKHRTNESFPWLLVWKSCMLPNICFFTREAIWGKIPTIGPASKKGFYPCK